LKKQTASESGDTINDNPNLNHLKEPAKNSYPKKKESAHQGVTGFSGSGSPERRGVAYMNTTAGVGS